MSRGSEVGEAWGFLNGRRGESKRGVRGMQMWRVGHRLSDMGETFQVSHAETLLLIGHLKDFYPCFFIFYVCLTFSQMLALRFSHLKEVKLLQQG